MRENLSSGFANNKGTDQPAHPRRLISTFEIRFSKNVVSELATGEILIFLLVTEAEHTALSVALSETPQDRFPYVVSMGEISILSIRANLFAKIYNPFSAIHYNCHLLAHLLMNLGSLYCIQC